MIVYANSRQSGKSEKAIILASSTNSILVVADDDRAKFIERQAIEIHYPVNVVVAKRYFSESRNRVRYRDDERIVIDDLDAVLRQIFGCEIIMATTTGCTADIDIKDEDNTYLEKHYIVPKIKY